MIVLSCEACQRPLKIAAEVAGESIRCPTCRATFIVWIQPVTEGAALKPAEHPNEFDLDADPPPETDEPVLATAAKSRPGAFESFTEDAYTGYQQRRKRYSAAPVGFLFGLHAVFTTAVFCWGVYRLSSAKRPVNQSYELGVLLGLALLTVATVILFRATACCLRASCSPWPLAAWPSFWIAAGTSITLALFVAVFWWVMTELMRAGYPIQGFVLAFIPVTVPFLTTVLGILTLCRSSASLPGNSGASA